jgi:hypothetical protein
MLLSGLSGMGPLGLDFASIVVITEMEKCGWKNLSFALLLGFGGIRAMQYSRPKGFRLTYSRMGI